MIAWNVTALKVLPGHRLEVGFADGLRGIVDMSKDDLSGVFAPLVDESYFALATIHDGVVVWPNGVDIAPEAMYDEVSGRHLGIWAFGHLRRSVCASLVLEEGVQLRVVDSGAVLRSCQKPEVGNADA